MLVVIRPESNQISRRTARKFPVVTENGPTAVLLPAVAACPCNNIDPGLCPPYAFSAYTDGPLPSRP